MPNMSYCRFENTLQDLKDCYEHLSDIDHEEMSEDEIKARERLIALCKKIVDEYVW